MDSKGRILNNLENYVTYLNTSDYTKGKLKYNQFLERKEFDNEEYTDFTESNIMLDMSRVLGFDPSNTKLTTAINNVFDNNKYNPTVDYINSLEWDGKKRIETLFIDWLGAADTKLNREMTRKWMIAAIKRVLEPGCKFDNMIVLKGPQGCGKSLICERLSHGFYNEHINIEDPKCYVETISRSWIACFDELSGISRKELADIKSFLSKSEDTVRLAYARNPQTYKRHCIFIGSTNEDNFLRDFNASIERRFWVIECTRDNTNNIVGANFTEDIKAQAKFTGETEETVDLDLKYSSLSICASQTKTNNFKMFIIKRPLKGLKRIDFTASVNGVNYPVHFSFAGSTSPFNRPLKRMSYMCEGLNIRYNEIGGKAFFTFRKATVFNKLHSLARNIRFAPKIGYRNTLTRLQAPKYKKEHKIWLYCDSSKTVKDNAYYQFLHDVKKKDGIERYYIYNSQTDIKGWFDSSLKKYLLPYGSLKHRLHCLCADKVLTSFYGLRDILPYPYGAMKYFFDLVITQSQASSHTSTLYLIHSICSFLNKF